MKLPSSLLWLAAAGAACATPPSLELRRDPTCLPDLRPADFPGAGQLLHGFDPLTSGPEWRRGDRALLGLQLQRGSQQRRWLVELVVDRPLVLAPGRDGAELPVTQELHVPITGAPEASFTSELMAASVRVFDHAGAPLGHSQVDVPRQFMEIGFATVCGAGERQGQLIEVPAPGPDAPPPIMRDGHDIRPHVEAMVTLLSLLGIVQDDPILSPILWEVVEKPSILSVIWNLGVDVTVSAEFHKAARVDQLPDHLRLPGPAWTVPVVVKVNDAPALYCSLLVTSTHAPLTLCGGIVGLEAWHPTDASLRFSMMLLAARRGTESAEK